MTSNQTAACQIARIVWSHQLRVVVAAECAIAPLVIVPNLLLLMAVWRLTVFPSNLRVIIGYLASTFLLFAVTTIIRSLYLLLSPVCAFQLSFRNCKIFELATGLLVVPQLYFCLFSLCIERLFATLRFRDENKKPWLGCSLVVCSQIALLCIYARDVFSLPDDQYMPICDGSGLPRPSYLMHGFMTMEVIMLIITAFVYFYNRHVSKHISINRAIYDLSARFLVDQNVQVNTIVMPSIALHFITHLPTVALLLPVGSSDYSQSTKILVLRSTILCRLLYAIADPLLAFYFNTHLRKILMKGPVGRGMRNIGCKVGPKEIGANNPAVQTAAHFAFLQKSWTAAKNGEAGQIRTISSDRKSVTKQAFQEES